MKPVLELLRALLSSGVPTVPSSEALDHLLLRICSSEVQLMRSNAADPINILLVEDDPGDVILTLRALSKAKFRNNLMVVEDGVDAIQFLNNEGRFADMPRPDLILLDLNLPRKDGRQTMAELKADANLRCIPVIVLTASDADLDVIKSYELQASCFVTKPVDLGEFTNVVGAINDFWLNVVKYPPHVGVAVQ